MQSNPRTLVNLLVISVKILVILLVKPTKSGYRGAIGAPGGSRDDLSIPKSTTRAMGPEGPMVLGLTPSHGLTTRAKG